MPRPSRNLDRALLAAGRALLPRRGCAGLSVREVADAAGVNLGMFHYHFRTREAFLRELLQSMYEEMFSQLTLTRPASGDALEHMRATLRFLGRFLRANRPVIGRVMADAMCGDRVAVEFLRDNMPRHIGVLAALVEIAQREGRVREMPIPQAVAFCAGSLAAPIVFAGAAIEAGALPAAARKRLEAALLSDAAIDARIDLALAAITQTAKPARAARRRKSA
jgi:AcrR family transcriptional regulator